MKKTITLTVQQAKELYEKDNSFRGTILSEFTDSELGIKKELKNYLDLKISGFYIGSNTSGVKSIDNLSPSYDAHNVFATKKQAESALAMAQLSQLMADLGDECDVDWGDDNQGKYVITREGMRVNTYRLYSSFSFLAFKTESVRDAFLEKHEELIKQYFMI